MSNHVFRNPDLYQQLPFRDYIRQHCPGANAGLIVTDLDMIINHIGALVDRRRDEDGRISLVELKDISTALNYTQSRTMQLMHKLMRASDPEHKFYRGSYLLQWDNKNNVPCRINGKPVTEQEFVDWMIGKLEIPSLFDGEGR